MNHISLRPLSVGIALIAMSLPAAQAQDAAVAVPPDRIAAQPVLTLKVENARTGEQLLALARTAGVSMLADATFFAPDSPPASFEEANTVRGLLLEMAYQEQLSSRQLDDGTLLAWSEPDTHRVMEGLIAHADQVKVAVPVEAAVPADSPVRRFQMLHPEIGNQVFNVLLGDFLQKDRGWDGDSSTWQADIPWAELPPVLAKNLREIVLAGNRANTASQRAKWQRDAAWFSDATWRSARIGYFRDPTKREFLAVKGSIEGAELFSSLFTPGAVTSPPSRWRPTAVEDQAAVGAPPAGALDQDALHADDALAATVSCEVREVPLAELVAILATQVHNRIVLAPRVLTEKRITARLASMPLHRAMAALTALYGVAWVKMPDGSYLARNGLSAAEIDALQIGDMQNFRYWGSLARREIAPPRLTLSKAIDWSDELRNAGVAVADLQSPDGVPVKDLPAGLREQVRYAVERSLDWRLISSSQNLARSEAVSNGTQPEAWRLRVARPSIRQTSRLGARTVDTTPPLKATVSSGGTPLYSCSIYGQQARQRGRPEAARYIAIKDGNDGGTPAELNAQAGNGTAPAAGATP